MPTTPLATGPVAHLEEPFSFRWLSQKPVQHIGVNLRANLLHEVTRQTVAI